MTATSAEREVEAAAALAAAEVADTGLSWESAEWSVVIWWRGKEKAEQHTAKNDSEFSLPRTLLCWSSL